MRVRELKPTRAFDTLAGPRPYVPVRAERLGKNHLGKIAADLRRRGAIVLVVAGDTSARRGEQLKVWPIEPRPFMSGSRRRTGRARVRSLTRARAEGSTCADLHRGRCRTSRR